MDPAICKAAIYGGHNTTISYEDFTSADSNIDPQQVTCGQGNTILHVATIGGNKTFVEKILQSYPLLVYKVNMKGQTALHIAARSGHLEVAYFLINCAKRTDTLVGVTTEDLLTMVDKEKNTALHEAVRYGHYDIVELLVKEKPSLTCLTNDDGESPLFIAVDRKFYEIAREILGTFPNCSCSGRNGMTVMHAAVIRLQFISVHFGRIRINGNVLWRAPLRRKCRVLLSWLFTSCVNSSIFGFQKTCIPDIVSEELVNEVLEKCGRDILEVPDEYGWMPLHYAARIGNCNVIELFLETNKSLAYIKDNQGMSPLHISAGNGRGPAISSLIWKCPDICELLDKKGRTALHVAVETGYITSTNSLLRNSFYCHLINEKDFEGNTALHLSALHGQYKILVRLVNDHRVDKGAVNKAGMTVIDIIRSSTTLSNDRKVSFTAMLKRKGSEPSLERRVFVRERIIHQIDEIRRYEMIQETHDEHLSTSSTSGTKNNHGVKIKSKKAVRNYYGRWSPELLKNLVNVNLLVATIIASITFSAAITMPGGYDSTDGIAILKTKTSFRYFLAFDSLAFGCSAASMSIHFLVSFTSRVIHETYSYPIACVLFLTLLSIASTVCAFVAGTNAVLQRHRSGFGLSAIIAFTSFTLPLFFFFIRIVMVLFKRLHSFIATDK